MTKTHKTICIYHANCADGFTAAWAVREALGDEAEYIPASYGQEPPDVTGADVIMVDFSYKRPVLDRMAQAARSILILDHHKTAAEDLAGLAVPLEHWDMHCDEAGHHIAMWNVCAIFDMDRSGAQLAWDYFHGTARPELVEYVADRDLWKWELDGSREVSAVLASHEHDFGTWSDLATRLDGHLVRAELLAEGAAILRAAP